jgi:hypothetical protein
MYIMAYYCNARLIDLVGLSPWSLLHGHRRQSFCPIGEEFTEGNSKQDKYLGKTTKFQNGLFSELARILQEAAQEARV